MAKQPTRLAQVKECRRQIAAAEEELHLLQSGCQHKKTTSNRMVHPAYGGFETIKRCRECDKFLWSVWEQDLG